MSRDFEPITCLDIQRKTQTQIKGQHPLRQVIIANNVQIRLQHGEPDVQVQVLQHALCKLDHRLYDLFSDLK